MAGKAPGAADLRAAFEQPNEEHEELDEVVEEQTDEVENQDEDESEDQPEAELDGDIDYEAEYGCTEEEYNQAVADGWNPNFKGKNARSAKDFLDRGSLFRKIETEKRRADKLEAQVKKLAKHAREAAKLGREAALAELQTQRRVAQEDGDMDRVDELNDKIADTRREIKDIDNGDDDVDEGEPVVELHPDIQDFVDTNTWYNSHHENFNPEMQSVADSIGKAYMDSHPNNKSIKRVLDHVVGRMKELYPSEFGVKQPSRRKQPSRVEGGGKRPARKTRGGTHSASDLTSDERMVMKAMIRKGNFKNEDEYIQSLEDSGYWK